jgi:hypothetical protein
MSPNSSTARCPGRRSWRLRRVRVRPGFFLRLIVLAYERDNPRRDELIAELYLVPRIERPFWVLQQLETALFEGLWQRIVCAVTDRTIYRWKLGSGVKYNRKHPDTSGSPTRSNARPLSPASSSRGRWCAGGSGVTKDGRWNGRVSRCAEHPGPDNYSKNAVRRGQYDEGLATDGSQDRYEGD